MSEQRFNPVTLTAAQQAALRHVSTCIDLRQVEARQRLEELLQAAHCSAEQYTRAMQSVRASARVAVHFHPDRLSANARTVAQGLLDDGLYRNQFETGLSSGSLTAHAGGERDLWERTLFGGAYHAAQVTASERPKYGALVLIQHPDGPSPRFGSCHFVLHPSVSARCSYTFAGSEQALAAERLGRLDAMDSVMAALLRELARGGGAAVPWPPFLAPTLGIVDLTVTQLLDELRHTLQAPPTDRRSRAPGRVLDSGIEAQVHGPLRLHEDVETLVIDPSFDGTATGELLDTLCRRYGITKETHGGFQLPVHAVPDGFRGPAMPLLARRIAVEGHVDAAVIGAAEATLHTDPQRWADWGTREQTRQQLKQLWHVVVHCGVPAPPRGAASLDQHSPEVIDVLEGRARDDR